MYKAQSRHQGRHTAVRKQSLPTFVTTTRCGTYTTTLLTVCEPFHFFVVVDILSFILLAACLKHAIWLAWTDYQHSSVARMEHCLLTDTSRNSMNVCWVLWWGPLFVRVRLQTLQGLVSTSSPKPWHVQKKAVSKEYKICFIHRRTGQRTQHTCTIQAIDCTGTPQSKLRHKPLDAFTPNIFVKAEIATLEIPLPASTTRSHGPCPTWSHDSPAEPMDVS